MSAELIAILAVGVAVAGIGINGQRTARQDIKELREDLGKRIDDLRQEMKQDIAALRADMDGRLRTVEHGQAKLEGLLEGLREAIAGRKDAA